MEYYSALKKEGNYDTCYNMDESWGYCAKWNKPVTKRQILYDSNYMRYYIRIYSTYMRIYLYDSTYRVVKFIETKLPGAVGEKTGINV